VRENRTPGSMSGEWKRSMARLLRHRQPKGPETDRPNLNHRVTPRLYRNLGGTLSRAWTWTIRGQPGIGSKAAGRSPLPCPGLRHPPAREHPYCPCLVTSCPPGRGLGRYLSPDDVLAVATRDEPDQRAGLGYERGVANSPAGRVELRQPVDLVMLIHDLTVPRNGHDRRRAAAAHGWPGGEHGSPEILLGGPALSRRLNPNIRIRLPHRHGPSQPA
jgi:hypothetical protein